MYSLIASLMLSVPIPCDFEPGPVVIEGTVPDYAISWRIFFYTKEYAHKHGDFEEECVKNPAIWAARNLFGGYGVRAFKTADGSRFVQIQCWIGTDEMDWLSDEFLRTLATIPGVVAISPLGTMPSAPRRRQP